jgi:hypothetical protein
MHQVRQPRHLEELLELGGRMALVQTPDDIATRHDQCGERDGGAVAEVVVASSLGGPRHHGQDRLEAAERLDLSLLVDAEQHGSFGGIEVEAHDVAHLLDKQRVGGELEGLGPMGLEAEGMPDPPDGGLAQPHLRGHRTGGPVGGVVGLLFEGLDDHGFHLVIGDSAWNTRSRVTGRTVEAVFGESTASLADHRLTDPQLSGNTLIGVPLGAARHDACPHGRGLGACWPGVRAQGAPRR